MSELLQRTSTLSYKEKTAQFQSKTLVEWFKLCHMVCGKSILSLSSCYSDFVWLRILRTYVVPVTLTGRNKGSLPFSRFRLDTKHSSPRNVVWRGKKGQNGRLTQRRIDGTMTIPLSSKKFSNQGLQIHYLASTTGCGQGLRPRTHTSAQTSL